MNGAVLKYLRGALGLTAKEMAEGLGISPSYLSEVENDKKSATMGLLRRYAEILDVAPSDLAAFAERYDAAVEKGEIRAFKDKLGKAFVEEAVASHR